MSAVGSSTISGTPSPFFIFSVATALGRKSATAAAMTTTSARVGARRAPRRASARRSRPRRPRCRRSTGRSTVVTSTTSRAAAPGAAPRSRGPSSPTTGCRRSAPDRSARACRPRSRAPGGPRARPVGACRAARARAATMRSGSASRPSPTSPPARRPASGSSTCTPRRRSVARFSCTAACSHISVCIAGHTSTGARVASSVAVSRSSEMPAAYLPMQLRGRGRDDDEVGALAEPRVRDRLRTAEQRRARRLRRERRERERADEPLRVRR